MYVVCVVWKSLKAVAVREGLIGPIEQTEIEIQLGGIPGLVGMLPVFKTREEAQDFADQHKNNPQVLEVEEVGPAYDTGK